MNRTGSAHIQNQQPGRAELELLGEQPALPAELVSDVSTAQAKLVDLVLLVERLLILARPKQDSGEPKEIVSLRDVMEDVLHGVDATSARHVTLMEGDALVRGDATLLSTMFTNALSNALKFGSHVDVALTVADGVVVLHVDDDGPGLDEAERERVFEPFFRGEGALRRRAPGHGLGLALVRHIAESHGGRAAFRTREGRGARLEICLPPDAIRAHSTRLEGRGSGVDRSRG